MTLNDFLKTETQAGDRIMISDGWTEITVRIDYEDLFIRNLNPNYLNREIDKEFYFGHGVRVVRLKD